MDMFRAYMLGRRLDYTATFETTARLAIYSGPGAAFPLVPGSPLPVGTPVEIVQRSEFWALVDVMAEVEGVMGVQGWVHSRYLHRRDEPIRHPRPDRPQPL
jgi:uncharacterized protein YraI